MIHWYETFVNSFPAIYATWAPLFMFACLYQIGWGVSDIGMVGSSFYRGRIIRGIMGVILCLMLLWPLVLLAWVIHFVRYWNKSEFDEIIEYERRIRHG